MHKKLLYFDFRGLCRSLQFHIWFDVSHSRRKILKAFSLKQVFKMHASGKKHASEAQYFEIWFSKPFKHIWTHRLFSTKWIIHCGSLTVSYTQGIILTISVPLLFFFFFLFPSLFRLCEPKKDLIARVVKIIGKRKAIELLMETAEVEQNGGLFIVVRKMSSCGLAREGQGNTALHL